MKKVITITRALQTKLFGEATAQYCNEVETLLEQGYELFDTKVTPKMGEDEIQLLYITFVLINKKK